MNVKFNKEHLRHIVMSRKSRKRKEFLRHIIRHSLLMGNQSEKRELSDIKEITYDYYYWQAREALKLLHNGKDIIAEQMSVA